MTNATINTDRKFLVFFIIFLANFCYFGDCALLVLYLTKHCSINESHAFQLLGSFLTLSSLGAIFVFILRRLKQAQPDILFVGCLLLGTGYALLSIVNTDGTTLYIALAMVAIAQGMMSLCLGLLITTDYDENNPKKRNHFSLLYLMNILSQIIAPLTLGIFIGFSHYGGAMIFMFFITLLMGGFILSIANKVSIAPNTLLITFFAVISGSLLLQHPSLVHALILILFSLLLFQVLFQLFTLSSNERHSIVCFLFIHMTLVIGIINLRQLNTIITVFADTYVNRTLFNWTIPTISILSLETVFVLLFMWLVFNRSTTRDFSYFKSRFALGLLFISLAMLTLSMATFYAHQHKISLLWIFLFFCLLAAGEVNLIPNHLFSIAKLIPRKFYDQFIFFSGIMLAVSCYASAVISKDFSNQTLPFITYTENPLENYSHYFKLFFSINMLWITIFIVLGQLLGKSRIPKKLD